MKNYKNILIILFLIPALISSQDDKEQLRKIYKTSLINGHSYDWLDYLSNEIGSRLSGSLNAEKRL